MHRAKVILIWIASSESDEFSRRHRFSLPARFDHQGKNWKEDAWSLVVEIDGKPNVSGHQYGVARFLVPNAPQAWLSKGRRFTLFEGSFALAEGRVEEVTK